MPALALVLALFLQAPAAAGDAAAELRALFGDAVRRHQEGDLAGAVEAYQRFLERQPRNVEALSNLGAALAAQGLYDQAVARYRDALAVDAGRTAVRLNLGVALQKAGRIAEAVPELEAVVAAEPGRRNAVVLLAEAHARLGEYRRAAERLAPLFEQAPDDRAVAYLYGLSLIQDKQSDRGKVVLDRVLRDGASAETHLLLGAVKLGAGEYAAAREDLQRGAELNPSLPMVHGLLGRVLMNVGEPQAAAAAFRRELAVNPNDFDANLLLGVMLKQDNQLADAQARFEKAVSLRPRDAAAAYQLGALRLHRGDVEGARALLEEVVALAPDFLEAHVSLSLAYYRLKRKDEGDKHRAIVLELQRKQQDQQPGAKAGAEPYRGEPAAPPVPEPPGQ